MDRPEQETAAAMDPELQVAGAATIHVDVAHESAEVTALVVREHAPEPTLPETLFYLGLGSVLFALEGAQRVGERGAQTVASAAATTAEHSAERVGDAVASATAQSVRLTKRMIGLPWRITKTVARAGAEALNAAEQGVAVAREGGRSAAERFADTGRHAKQETENRISRLVAVPLDLVLEPLVDHLAEHPQVQRLIRTQVDLLLPELSDDEQITALIETQVAQLLPSLMDDAQVQALIRQQANTYVQYLQDENPALVQDLIQGQSIDLAADLLDEVRERTVSMDALVERVVRSVLRRKPREELALPSPVVRRQAVHLRRRPTQPTLPSAQDTTHD